MKKVKTLFKGLAQDLRNNLGHLHYFKVGVQKAREGQLCFRLHCSSMGDMQTANIVLSFVSVFPS